MTTRTSARVIARPRWSRPVAAAEVGLAVAVVLLVAAIPPTLVLIALAAASLLVRREGWRTLGLRRGPSARVLVPSMLAVAVAWTVVELGLVMPLAEHATGQVQDVSDFAEVEGNLSALALLLVLSWTLAAVGEELAYRGYLTTRLAEVLGPGRTGVTVTVLASATVFGLAHTEQGVVGVVLAGLSGVLYGVLRLATGTLWAPVLVHGFVNTIGFVAFYLVGPVGALW